jgi:hypothetical protein
MEVNGTGFGQVVGLSDAEPSGKRLRSHRSCGQRQIRPVCGFMHWRPLGHRSQVPHVCAIRFGRPCGRWFGTGRLAVLPHAISAVFRRDYLGSEARRCLSQTRPNNATLIAVRMAPAIIQMGVSAGKKSPLLSRMKAQAPASSISPQNPVATAGSIPLDPLDSFRGKSGTGSRLNGAELLRGLSVGSSADMT